MNSIQAEKVSEWTRLLSDPKKCFDFVNDPSCCLKKFASIVRVNKTEGGMFDKKANIRILLNDGTEATIEAWAYGCSDGGFMEVERVR